EALGGKERGKGADAAAVAGLGQLALDVIDGQVAFAHGEDQVADRILRGRGGGLLARGGKEGGAPVCVVAKLMAQDTEGAGGVAEAFGDLRRGKVIHEACAERLVLVLHGRCGSDEEASSLGNG